MKSFTYPHTIENCIGEKIIFSRVEATSKGDQVFVEAWCKPHCGPAMHTHHKQEEELTVVSGKMGYLTLGGEVKFAKPGESVLFRCGEAHKFWAEGEDELHIQGSIMPANTIVFFLTALYAAQNKSGKGQPEAFDGAYLTMRYSSEYDAPEIPGFVRYAIIPLTYLIGKLLGKYKHFSEAPEPM